MEEGASPPGRHGTMSRMAPGPDDDVAKMRRGALQYCALALLSHGEWPGFELVRALAGESGLAGSEGVVYPLLAHLRGEGLVDAAWRELRPGQSRRCYSITPAGLAALESFTRKWQELRDRVDVFLQPGEGA
jgi:PadR family transcriptional regulator PadR